MKHVYAGLYLVPSTLVLKPVLTLSAWILSETFNRQDLKTPTELFSKAEGKLQFGYSEVLPSGQNTINFYSNRRLSDCARQTLVLSDEFCSKANTIPAKSCKASDPTPALGTVHGAH